MSEAALVLRLCAADPALGVVLRGPAGPGRDAWLQALRAARPGPWRRVPASIGDGRLLGGLDLAATLQAGRAVQERGVLEEAAGGTLVLAMAERLPVGTAARIAAAMDAGAGFGVVALDEGLDDERCPAALLDRVAFHLDVDERWDVDGRPLSLRERVGVRVDPRSAESGSGADPHPDPLPGGEGEVIASLCATALALGIWSVRAPMHALAVARAVAALDGRDAPTLDDAAIAARLVLAPRATQIPGEPEAEAPEPEAQPETEPDTTAKPQEDVVLEAARAAIPPGLLDRLQAEARARQQSVGSKGALQSGRRGRPVGVRAGDPRRGERLNVVETLRAAAPWQRLRQRQDRIEIRRDDFRVSRLKQRSETTTIFCVDASGSQAMNRLAEAKGAVELLLAESYVRRDRVAVIAFRGRGTELLLPPTRSLVRAKRGLAGLPGGGGTPLAQGIDAGAELALLVRRRGGTPTLVLLTDGRANVGRDGRGGRARAEQEALAAARVVRMAGLRAVLIDTSTRPDPASRRLAEAMAARYVPLPYARPELVSAAVRG